MPPPCIITCAISGRTSRIANSRVPFTPEEQAIAASEAIAAGASVIHLHCREDDGSPAFRVERIMDTLAAINEKCPDAIVELSTRASGQADGIDRGACLSLNSMMWGKIPALKPKMCSLNMGSINLGEAVFLNTPEEIRDQAMRIYVEGIVPELDIFDVSQLENALELLQQGILKAPLNFLFVLGAGGLSANPVNLLHLVNLLPKGMHWTALGAGKNNFPIASLAIALGGHVRTGLEDTTYISKGVKAASNAQLVSKLAEFVREAGRKVATPEEAKKILGISANKGGSNANLQS
jgi:3-keto-5-aminohexanoate cleavage enzyme